MKTEGDPRGEITESIRVGVVDLEINGLHAEDAIGRNGQVEIRSNLKDPNIQSRIENLLGQPRYKLLVDGIKSGEKIAFASFKKHMTISLVVVSVGTIAAAAAALEFGVRHGQDVREVIDLFKPKEEPKL